ncbi:MAG: Rossmann-like and DUF2520 domain-containing protein [Tannerella forsythia]|uniref:Rossmann-like and DUF2520 domain-containing protein n=1 Tax=Tannerella forsythia TaxID=28112 RepID=UPI0036062B9E
MKVVFIGAGNVATHLSAAMRQAGLCICQIYSRTEKNAQRLAAEHACAWTTDTGALRSDADLYVFALKDAVLHKIVTQVSPNEGLWLHTAGSVPMDIFRGYARRYGVLYPLQTFSKKRPVDFRNVPCFIEADSAQSEQRLRTLAEKISSDVRLLSFEKRRYLHLAAVFACNFTNHMYVLADRILSEQGIDPAVLLPLIDETAAKIHSLSPADAQTGPAVRYDRNVIEQQSAMLTDPVVRELYELISKNIHLLSQS